MIVNLMKFRLGQTVTDHEKSNKSKGTIRVMFWNVSIFVFKYRFRMCNVRFDDGWYCTPDIG